MYPDRIHRLVLDGVVDTSEYYSINRNNIVDADAIMHRFAEYCYAAGPDKCTFYSGDGASDIYASIEDVADSLYKAPLVAQTTFMQSPDIVTYSDLMGYIFHALYNPYESFGQMAEVLANLRSSNGSMLAALKRRDAISVCSQKECRAKSPASDSCEDVRAFQEEAVAGVACADGADVTNMTKAEYKAYAKAFMEQSRWLGSVWATAAVTMPCVHWNVRPAQEFHGAFTDPFRSCWISAAQLTGILPRPSQRKHQYTNSPCQHDIRPRLSTARRASYGETLPGISLTRAKLRRCK